MKSSSPAAPCPVCKNNWKFSLHGFLCALLLIWSSSALARQPNIVILLADDLGWADVGYHGSPIETPSIDRLAAEGVQLDRFYSTPICSPTRAALMTGRDPLKLGIAYDQIHPWYNVGLSPKELTIADVFKLDGYQTALVGKWHLGHTLGHQVTTLRVSIISGATFKPIPTSTHTNAKAATTFRKTANRSTSRANT